VTVEGERVLCVAGFDDAQLAHHTFRSLLEEPAGAPTIEVAVLIARAQDGRADVVEARRGGRSENSMDVLTPLVIGIFAPPLILSEAIEDGYGDVIRHMTKRHDTGELEYRSTSTCLGTRRQSSRSVAFPYPPTLSSCSTGWNARRWWR
jgi:hypothetical protein